ncbi:hypothetical protein LGN57_21775, partial [Escherichia coli]|uniref:hypothetical protein n=1 Tax=Escherichia coli TaxID=562 RepID=UPI001CF18A9B
EWVHVQLHQQKGMISLSPPTICNSAAGTASCRIEVEGIDELYQHIKPLGILHPNTSLKDQWWDERDFAVIDPDNNLISFFQQIKS